MGDGADDALDMAIGEMLYYGLDEEEYSEDFGPRPGRRCYHPHLPTRKEIQQRGKKKYSGEESGE